MDYRRWIRQNKVQTEVHTKLLERLTGNDELLAYIQSPAGAKFLESSPITLDAGPRNVGAPLGRILWTIQAGVVLLAGGVGLLMVGAKMTDDAAQGVSRAGYPRSRAGRRVRDFGDNLIHDFPSSGAGGNTTAPPI